MSANPLRLAFLASHGGSAMRAIAQACRNGDINATPVLVISNNSKPQAFARGAALGLETHHMSGKTHPGDGVLDQALANLLDARDIDLIILSGFMRKIGSEVLQRYDGRILNVHPALLPKYGGQGFYGDRVHRAVLDAGERESGATIHLIDGEYDTGPILLQGKVPVRDDDTPHTLAARVLEVELQIYVEALQKISSGEITLEALT